MLPPHSRLLGRAIPGEEELLVALLAETPWEDHHLRLFGRDVPMPRRIAMYGPHGYRYSGAEHAPRPLTPRLDRLRLVVERRAGVPFNTVLLNLYRDERDSVGWHTDGDYDHGGQPVVASVSLGATRRFQVRERSGPGRWSLELEAGSLLLLEAGFQERFLHAVPKGVSPVGARINLTFRHMAAGVRG